jgi:hypothetical protein
MIRSVIARRSEGVRGRRDGSQRVKRKLVNVTDAFFYLGFDDYHDCIHMSKTSIAFFSFC